MKQNLFLALAVAVTTFTTFAQTTPPPAPAAPAQPRGTINGFAPNAVSGFTPGVVRGFSPNPIGGLTPMPRSIFPPGTIAPLSTSIGGAGTNTINTVPLNPNVIVVPRTPFQPPVGTFPTERFPTNANGTNRVLLTPLF